MEANKNLTLDLGLPSTVSPAPTTNSTPIDPAKEHEELVLNIVIPIFVIIAFIATLFMVFHWPSKQADPESSGNLELKPMQGKAKEGRKKRKRYGSINEACDEELEIVQEVK
ncbi:unnamed protein product [Owenia fusiformis]|uniref:Uncharacterized protein n=1 Tax=Owenia fusiformis TaxID=6347 RepID=A0A8J1UF20_OWEFU|nr:unnamed protein product [Owenia fusiformis]